ncbi:hypothetical protein ACKF11_13110 [Methylobacillus sp. Pita2]|uniref:hypothetical protein n=1 Tax=Methylobacillus sp. Pita2 TaxID=3383245 RepID=UPI0038B5F0CB
MTIATPGKLATLLSHASSDQMLLALKAADDSIGHFKISNAPILHFMIQRAIDNGESSVSAWKILWACRIAISKGADVNQLHTYRAQTPSGKMSCVDLVLGSRVDFGLKHVDAFNLLMDHGAQVVHPQWESMPKFLMWLADGYNMDALGYVLKSNHLDPAEVTEAMLLELPFEEHSHVSTLGYILYKASLGHLRNLSDIMSYLVQGGLDISCDIKLPYYVDRKPIHEYLVGNLGHEEIARLIAVSAGKMDAQDLLVSSAPKKPISRL